MCDILVDSVCRLCLKEDFSLISIFSCRSPSGEPVYRVLNYIYGLKILQGDGFPPQICVPCLWKVLEFDTYKRNVYNAEAEIKQLLKRTGPNLIEVSSEEANNVVLGGEEIRMNDASEVTEDLVDEMVVPHGFHFQFQLGKVLDETTKYFISMAFRKVSIKQEIVIEEWKMPEDIQCRKDILEGQSSGTDYRLNEGNIIVHSDLVSSDVATVKAEGIKAAEYCNREFSPQEQLNPSECEVNDSVGDREESFETEENGICMVNIPGISIIDSDEATYEKDAGKVGAVSIDVSKSEISEIIEIEEESDVFNSEEPVNSRPFICDVCSRGFCRKLDLGRHLRIHYNDRPFKCTVCDQAFTRRDVRKTHEQRHYREKDKSESIKKTYSCEICSKKYNSEITLKRHSNLHKNTYLCYLCGKSLSSNFNLKNHLRVHSNEQPFSCKFCDKKFKTKHGMTDHEMLHLRNS